MRDVPDAAYGEQAAMQEIQSGAPMAMADSMAQGGPSGGAPSEGAPSIIPLNAPTQSPDMPGQSGASMGPGLGLDSLGLPNPAQQLDEADLERIKDMLPFLETMANQPGSMPSTRQLVRRLKSAI